MENNPFPFSSPQTLFRNVWADHADLLSLQYAGTPALKTDFTRTGRRTARGMVGDLRSQTLIFPVKFCILKIMEKRSSLRNSIVRYYKNNFSDGFRQVIILIKKYLVRND